MKFRDKATGNILTTTNERAISLMQGNPDKYEAVDAKASKKAAKAAKAEKAE